MVEASAPGKLYIAGEYAVVEPGHPSIVVAVDRFITARLTEAESYGTIRSLQYGNEEVRWSRKNNRILLEGTHESLDYVLAALHTTEQWLEENDTSLSFFHLTIESELDSDSGQKFGLGSSAAVTVAVIKGLLLHYGVEEQDELVYKLAALAHLSLGSNGSFGDLAASSYTGWVAYSSFDRETIRNWMNEQPVTEVIQREWPSLSIERLTPPPNLQFLIGWTGSPASTTELVDQVSEKRQDSGQAYAGFLDKSKQCVARMIEAFNSNDLPSIQKEIRKNRFLLNQLKSITGTVIETPALTRLCEIAESCGAAAKSSGAGGGDCGIALCGPSVHTADLIEEWASENITPLPLTVYDKKTTK